MSDPAKPAAPAVDREVLEVALDAVRAAVLVVDPGGRILAFNRTCERLTGFQLADVAGRVFWDVLIPPDEVEGVRELFGRLVAGRLDDDPVLGRYENDWVKRDGGRVRFAWATGIVRDEHGAVSHVVGTGLDVTRVHEAEVARRSSEAELARLVYTAKEGVWTIDTEGRTTFANPRMAEMLGCSLDELMDSSMWDWVDPTWRDAAGSNLEKRKQGVAEHHDFLLRRADGSELWTVMATSPVEDESGAVVGALAMVTDITERVRVEHHLEQLVHELDHRVKNNLASALALADETLERASDPARARVVLIGRLRAMAVGQELLSRGRWHDIDLERLVRAVLHPHVAGREARVRIDGPAVVLSISGVVSLALALHELGTNAVEHGALARSDGTVELSWRERERCIEIVWCEPALPLDAAPTAGVGLDLLADLVTHALQGELETETDAGLSFRIRLPWSAARTGRAPAADATVPEDG